VKVTESKTAVNRRVKSSLKTSIKKAHAVIAEGETAAAGEAYRLAQRDLDRAVAQGILHKNTAARRKSRLAAKLKSASA
jgi:small subunit ribosomal protein S20